MIVKIDIVNKRPSVVGTPVIVCGNSGYTIEFTFDGEWASAAVKTARFVYVKGGAVKHQDVAFSGTVVEVPILSEIRDVYVGVYAGDLRTTTPARIPCERSILCGTGTEHEEPDPDVYNQILEAVNQLIGEAGNHPARTDNPHGVTAEQVGARPADWMPTAAEVGARPADWMPTAREVGARPDTWMPSASEVGARPADWTPTAGEVGAQPAGNYYAAVESEGCPGCYYNMVNGEAEWINPPMIPNVAYRTTERVYHDGISKPVYTKRLEMGNLINGDLKKDMGISHMKVIRYFCIAHNEAIGATISFPHTEYGQNADCFMIASEFYIRTNTDTFNGYNANTTIWYTKD